MRAAHVVANLMPRAVVANRAALHGGGQGEAAGQHVKVGNAAGVVVIHQQEGHVGRVTQQATAGLHASKVGDECVRAGHIVDGGRLNLAEDGCKWNLAVGIALV